MLATSLLLQYTAVACRRVLRNLMHVSSVLCKEQPASVPFKADGHHFGGAGAYRGGAGREEGAGARAPPEAEAGEDA